MDNTPGDKLGVWRDMRLADALVIANLHAIFNDILRKNHGTLLYTTVSESVDGACS